MNLIKEKRQKPYVAPSAGQAPAFSGSYLFTVLQRYAIYTDYKSEKSVFQHKLVNVWKKGHPEVLSAAKQYAKECDCRINPEIHKDAKEARVKPLPGINNNSNPDLYTEKYGYIDVKSPELSAQLKKMQIRLQTNNNQSLYLQIQGWMKGLQRNMQKKKPKGFCQMNTITEILSTG